MSKKGSSNPSKRRDTLRKLAVSGGVIGAAGAWSKPVVDSVVLPAHAQTSLPLEDPCSGVTIIPLGPTTFDVKVAGFVLGPNNAGIPIHIEVRVSGGSTGPDTRMTNTTTNASGHYSATLGTFNGCDGPSVLATISSSAFAGEAQCSTSNAKKCIGAD
ncbi:MAG: hypothetical protein WAL83_07965 [Arenicellales bacterium]